MYIKARLQLLRNNGQSTGLPNQQNAPVPQDVHPQQYQNPGVGAPPGPQWGVPTGPPSVLHGPSPAQNGTAPDWSRRLADIPNPQPPPPPQSQSQAQPPSMYDPREPVRPPPSQRQSSPRQDQIRQYQEQHRHTPIRRASPPPNSNHNATLPYSAPQPLTQPQLPVSGPTIANRIPNPNYGAPDPSLRLAATGSNQLPPGPRAPYGRGDSPPPEIRPITESRVSPSGPNYPPQQHYQPHHPNTSQSAGIAAGAPPPIAALAATEAAARERDDRPSTGFKRSHESDDEYKAVNKHHANGESRSRLEDHRHRRASPPDRKCSPRPRPGSPRGRAQSPPYGRPSSPLVRHSRSSSRARREEQRRADESYHPSEAAHHPPTLPSMHQPTITEPPQTPISDTGREERREAYEAAARKMEVDEDYDDEGEEEKRKEGSGGGNSPQHNNLNGQSKLEVQK